MIVIMAEWMLRSRSIRALVHVRKMSPWLAWPMFLFPLILPWLIGGWGPDCVALTWGCWQCLLVPSSIPLGC